MAMYTYRFANGMFRGPHMDEVVKYLRALLAVQIQGLQQKEEREKIEVALSRAGLQHPEIAKILGKTVAAVQKAVSRSKGAA
jgi:hypothetical protein